MRAHQFPINVSELIRRGIGTDAGFDLINNDYLVNFLLMLGFPVKFLLRAVKTKLRYILAFDVKADAETYSIVTLLTLRFIEFLKCHGSITVRALKLVSIDLVAC